MMDRMNDIDIGQALRDKWKGRPTSMHEAEMALIHHRHCMACGSTMILSVIRPPMDVWKVHCNHCGTEMPIVVLMNRKAWRQTAFMFQPKEKFNS